MKKSVILKKAMKHLWDGKDSSDLRTGNGLYIEKFVCWSVETVAYLKADPLGRVDAECYAIQRWIEVDLLEGCGTLESWLYFHHPEFDQEDTVKLQKLRKKWMKWMIQYWKARGE